GGFGPARTDRQGHERKSSDAGNEECFYTDHGSTSCVAIGSRRHMNGTYIVHMIPLIPYRLLGVCGGSDAALGEVHVVEIREDIIFLFEVFEPALVDMSGLQSFVEAGEPRDMVLGPFDGVLDHRAGLHDKGPVGALGKQELPPGLRERAARRAFGVREPSAEFFHSVRRGMEMAVDPVIRAITPDVVISLV